MNGRQEPGSPDFLAEAVSRCRSALVTVGIYSFFINLLILAGPLYMLQVYDRVLSSGSVDTLVVLTGMVGGAILAMVLLEAARSTIAARTGSWLVSVLGPEYLGAGVRARLVGEGGGAQALRDLHQVQSFVAAQGLTALFDLPWTPLFIAVIWLLHPWLGMLALGTALLLAAVSIVIEVSTAHLFRDVTADQMAAQKLTEASVENAESVWAMGMLPALNRRWMTLNGSMQGAFLRGTNRSVALTSAAKFIRVFAQSAILGLGAYLVLEGQATAGVMIAASIMLGRALAPVDIAMSAWKNFQTARLAYRRLKTQALRHPKPQRTTALPAPRGGLEVRDLVTRGQDGAVLKKLSFHAEVGEAIAIIGPSGAGKSTLCRALAGLTVPVGGSVRLDGIELGRYNPDARGRHVGFLSQDIGLFAGTIRDNIARMGEADDADVVEAAQLAHAHELITSLPQGYETVLGERGLGLSAGQRQRIGLARAVFGNPSLILLDEPNSNLAQAGEAALASAIEELKSRGATLLIVGHRPSTLTQSDKIMLLRNGAIQAFGPRPQVLAMMRGASAAKAEGHAEGSAAADRYALGGAEPARDGDPPVIADAHPSRRPPPDHASPKIAVAQQGVQTP